MNQEESSLPGKPIDDRELVRGAGTWTKDKLGILAEYTPAFCRACSGKAPRWYYVDPFSGPGINRIVGTSELVWGSPLIALRAEPAFHRCLLLDRGAGEVRALRSRTAAFGERARVERGDCNRDLIPLMEEAIERRAPCLCVLDPEGMEVDWATIEAISRFRSGRFKVEQLILFAVDGLSRVMPLYPGSRGTEEALLRFWGHDGWKNVLEARQSLQLTADQARTQYLGLYMGGLKELGYRAVLNREIRDGGRVGRIKYFLVFATDNPAGERIMDWCFDQVFPREEQLFLPGLEPRARREG